MTSLNPVRYRRKAQVPLIEFLRPGGLQANTISVELAFLAFRELVRTSVGYTTKHHWHVSSVSGLLGGHSVDNSYPRPVTSLADLLSRFHLALLASPSPELDGWREAHKLQAYSVLELSERHYKPGAPNPHLQFKDERHIRELLAFLLVQAAGKKTSVSLNSIHLQAQVIHGVDVTVSPTGFAFVLRYGFVAPDVMAREGDSEWTYCLAATSRATGEAAKQQLKEPFLDTFRKALDNFDFVTDPANSHLMLELHHPRFTEKPVETVAA